jgi:hypothetical protein
MSRKERTRQSTGNRGRSRWCNSKVDRLFAMKPLELLKQLSFGVQVAEDETSELASYFVETNQWARIANGEIDIVRGEKGAGKSAIYSLLMQRSDDFFDDGILMVAAESPRGATVFKDLVTDPPTTEIEFTVLWKLYVLTIITQRLREFGVQGDSIGSVYHALEEAKLLEREFSLAGVLRGVRDYARNLLRAEAIEGGLKFDPITQLPTGVTGKIVLREPSSELKEKGIVSVDSLFEALNQSLEEHKFKVWVLLDRLDVAFIENHALEANALRALVRSYADIKGRDHISLKIFLREDIWKRIMEGGFREASHLIRYVILDWTQPALLNLIMRRLLNNKVLLEEFEIDSNTILQDADKQIEIFDKFFPKQVEQGPQKAPTLKWLITRCADGTRKTAPREIIHLLNCILEQEIKRLEQGGQAAPGDQLFDRSVFKLALPTVSDARLNQYLYAEYDSQRPFVSKLDGQKAEQTLESLSALWKVNRNTTLAKAQELVDLGFFEERGTHDEPTFWVPFLYRDALHLIQGRAESDEE